MPLVDAMVIIPMDSGLSADACVNTFTFNATPMATGTFDDIKAALSAFYGDIQAEWANTVDPVNVRLKLYDHAAPKPRAPLYDELLGLAVTTGVDQLPAEVAVCLSFQAERLSGVPQARRRGRIFFGPCRATMNANGRVYFESQTNFRDAMEAFATAAAGSATFDWVVSSGVAGTTPPYAPVASGWIDNAFDVQRRRGLEASNRYSWTLDD